MPLVVPYQNPENAFRVILGDFTTEDGTGIVHTSTLVPMMLKVAKGSNTRSPPMLGDENGKPGFHW
jgi:isoleucyl-tRNA synthetase